METPKIFDSELRFCEILWEHQPVRSSELAHLCAEKLGWKKSTTYTVIKRLTERGVVQTEDAVVTALVSRARCSGRRAAPLWSGTSAAVCPAFSTRSWAGADCRRRRQTSCGG